MIKFVCGVGDLSELAVMPVQIIIPDSIVLHETDPATYESCNIKTGNPVHLQKSAYYRPRPRCLRRFIFVEYFFLFDKKAGGQKV
jgi:hypothetical protein